MIGARHIAKNIYLGKSGSELPSETVRKKKKITPTMFLYLQFEGFSGLNLYLFPFYVCALRKGEKNQDKEIIQDICVGL